MFVNWTKEKTFNLIINDRGLDNSNMRIGMYLDQKQATK